MKIKATKLCQCGHEAWSHTYHDTFEGPECEVEIETVFKDSDRCSGCNQCLKYQLPNLDYIEYEAKRRGLI